MHVSFDFDSTPSLQGRSRQWSYPFFPRRGLGPEWTAGVQPSPALRPMRRHDDDRGDVRANQLANEMSPLSSSPLCGFELPLSAFSLDGYDDEDTPTNYQLSSENALGLFINDSAYLAADDNRGRRK